MARRCCKTASCAGVITNAGVISGSVDASSSSFSSPPRPHAGIFRDPDPRPAAPGFPPFGARAHLLQPGALELRARPLQALGEADLVPFPQMDGRRIGPCEQARLPVRQAVAADEKTDPLDEWSVVFLEGLGRRWGR